MLADFDYDQSTETLLCTFHCRMDSEGASRLPDLLLAKMDEILKGSARSDTLKVIFDLERVDYASSLFLRIALMAARRVKKEHFSIKNANELIRELIGVSGFTEWLAD